MCLCRGSICYVSVNLVLWGVVLCSEVRCVVANSGVAHAFLCMGGCKLHCLVSTEQCRFRIAAVCGCFGVDAWLLPWWSGQDSLRRVRHGLYHSPPERHFACTGL